MNNGRHLSLCFYLRPILTVGALNYAYVTLSSINDLDSSRFMKPQLYLKVASSYHDIVVPKSASQHERAVSSRRMLPSIFHLRHQQNDIHKYVSKPESNAIPLATIDAEHVFGDVLTPPRV
jgi:hypothetical protein